MTALGRILWYQSMAASDISALLSPSEIRDYLSRRHPIGKKIARRPENVIEPQK